MQAADNAGLPADTDFRAQFRAYIEWAVDEVMSYSPEGSQVPHDLEGQPWGWDGLERTALSGCSERVQ